MVGRKIGLAIGINDYSDPKISNLLFAKKDAEEMRTVLLNPDIGGFDEIIPLVNETKYNVKKGIEKLLLKDSTFNDLVLIYFSGHGKLNSKFELNLLLKDTETDYLRSTALHYNFITDCIEDSKCKKVIIILDCCHSGAAGIKGDLSKTLSETSGSGTFILSATTGSKQAKEVQELRNGIFTHFLLEGLMKGDADLGGDGLIDILEWYEYASKKCNDNYSQVTTIKTKFEERIVIGKNPLKAKKNKFELNVRELVKLRKELSVKLYDEAMTILIKDYESPSSLTAIEVEIKDSLDLLLLDEIKIGTYVHTVQYLKDEEYKKSFLKGGNLTLVSEKKQIITPFSTSASTYSLIENSVECVSPDIPKTFVSSSTGIEFVLIPAGSFMMGSLFSDPSGYDDQRPLHKVTIKYSYYMGKYPVTQKQWKEVMGANPSHFKGDDLPVEQVSWNDVQEFIKKINEKESIDKYRLPSEAEWEYACRAGTQTMYYFGEEMLLKLSKILPGVAAVYSSAHDNESKLSKILPRIVATYPVVHDGELKLNEHVWHEKNSDSKTHPVGQKKPNSWGLYDMHGNGCRTSGMKITILLLPMVALGKMEMVPKGFIGVVAGSPLARTAIQRLVPDAVLSSMEMP